MNLKETYNRIAEDWHRDHKEDDWWVKGTDIFASFLKKGDLVLDVGCGGGTKSRYLIRKGLKIIGIDFSEKLIEIAKREVPEATFFAMDLADAGKLDYEFDAIFMQAVLLHIPKKEAGSVLEKLLVKLKKRGYFYLAVKEKRPGGVDEEIKIENDHGYNYERFFSYFTLDEVEHIVKNAGLHVRYKKITPSGNTRWIQVVGNRIK